MTRLTLSERVCLDVRFQVSVFAVVMIARFLGVYDV